MKVRGRIDAVRDVNDTSLEQWLTTVGTDLVLVHHLLPQMEGLKWDTQEPYSDTTNPHYHFYLDTTFKSVQAMAYQMKKKFTALSKTDWSIKPCSDDRVHEYWQYLFNNKHGNKYRLIKSFTDMAPYIAKAEVITADFEVRRKEKQKSKTGYDISMELAEWINTMAYHERSNYREITCHAIKLHKLYKKSFCLFSLERVVITALGETAPELIATNVAVRLAQRLTENSF